MKSIIDHNRIIKRFRKSLGSYDQNAVVPHKMSDVLIEKLQSESSKSFDTILEIGCGTGYLTKKIVQNIEFKSLILNDILEDVIKIISDSYDKNICEKIEFIIEDAETTSFPLNLDLIISNATVQWFEDFERFLHMSHYLLSDSGYLCISTFGKNNLCEIRELTGIGLDYMDTDEIKEILEDKFDILFLKSDINTIYFDTAVESLQHMKMTGINALENISWTKKDLRNFVELYESKFKVEGKVPLTFEPLYIIAKKKN